MPEFFQFDYPRAREFVNAVGTCGAERKKKPGGPGFFFGNGAYLPE
jgi:hypothetical protein